MSNEKNSYDIPDSMKKDIELINANDTKLMTIFGDAWFDGFMLLRQQSSDGVFDNILLSDYLKQTFPAPEGNYDGEIERFVFECGWNDGIASAKKRLLAGDDLEDYPSFNIIELSEVAEDNFFQQCR